MNRPGVLKNPSEGVVAIRVLDLSASGLRVSLPCRLPLGAEVEIVFEDAVVQGLVRHCQCIGAAAFNLGIWVPEPVSEQHLSPYCLHVLRGGKSDLAIESRLLTRAVPDRDRELH